MERSAAGRPPAPDDRRLASAAHEPRILTARAATRAMVSREAKDWTVMRALAQGVRGIVSVGLKAVALVKAT